MDTTDRHWANIKDRYYTLKSTRKPLYLNELNIEKDTLIIPALHLMFSSDKIKEEFLYSENDPINSLMNGISNHSILGVVKSGEAFYLLVHTHPTHLGWHDGRFITTQFDLLFSYKEIVFIKGQEIMKSISDDAVINVDLYRRLKAMGDCNSLILKYEVYKDMNKYIDNNIDLILIMKSLPFINNKNKNLLKCFIIEIKRYLAKHKDFEFEKIFKNYFISLYESNTQIAAYIAKYLKKELKRPELE
jgi:hypothetical protein